MSSKDETVSVIKDGKLSLVPKLRFPEFRGTDEWRSEKVEELVTTVTPAKKIPTSLYVANGAFPIIDQSQSDICGWTDDNDAVIHEDLPLIVFGDHTCIFKLVNRPFAQGADGIKILKSRAKIKAQYLYQFLCHRPVTTEEYKRHYSILKEKFVVFPNVTTGEQQKIGECLSSVDEVIAAQARKAEALKTQKNGLMQQLFPREGETWPRLRFPEFRGEKEWERKSLVQMIEIASGQVDPTEPPYCDWPQIGSENMEPGTGKLVNVKSAADKGVMSGNYVFDESDILYSKIRPALNKVAAPTFKGICSADIYPIRPADHGLLRSYLLYLLLSPEFLGYAIRNSERGKIPKINRAALHTFEAAIPSTAEQQRIADCLSSLDALITAVTEEVEALKRRKRGLMQQLFPAVDEG